MAIPGTPDALVSALEETKGRLATAEAALQQVTAERDGWKSTLRYCEREWQDERGTMLAKIAAANAEVARLQSALKQIADACPVTCDMSLAHDMAATAEHALARAATAREGA